MNKSQKIQINAHVLIANHHWASQYKNKTQLTIQ